MNFHHGIILLQWKFVAFIYLGRNCFGSIHKANKHHIPVLVVVVADSQQTVKMDRRTDKLRQPTGSRQQAAGR